MKKALLVFALVLVFSCAKKSNEITIRYWAFGGTPEMNIFEKKLCDEFSRTHPGVQVEMSLKNWNLLREILYTSLSAGAGPDLMRTHANYAAEFGPLGFFYPIDSFPDFQQVKKLYLENVFETTRYADHYYGLPSNGIAFSLICNRDLFDQAGIKPPATWSEFRAAAKHFTKDVDGNGTMDQYGLSLMGADRGGYAYRWIPFLLRAGGKLLSEDHKSVLLNNAAGYNALKLFADMYQLDHSITPGFLGYGPTEISDLLANDKIAMAIEGPWASYLIHQRRPQKQLYHVAIPVPDSLVQFYETLPTLEDQCMMPINGASKYKEMTWELVKYLRRPEADMEWIRQDFGATPVALAVLNSPEAEKSPDLLLYRHLLEYAKPLPNHCKIVPIVNDLIAPYTMKAVSGEMGVQPALDEAARLAQAMLEGKR